MALSVKQIEEVRSIMAKLDGVQSEISAAVKRNASAPVSNFQLKLINGVLSKANDVLGKDKPLDGFDQFEPDDLPTAADVSMIVTQYAEAFEKLRCENIDRYNGQWVWVNASHIQTVPPRGRK